MQGRALIFTIACARQIGDSLSSSARNDLRSQYNAKLQDGSCLSKKRKSVPLRKLASSTEMMYNILADGMLIHAKTMELMRSTVISWEMTIMHGWIQKSF